MLVEHEQQGDDLEREADRLEQESERVGKHIEETRRDWEAKEDDPRVPGAQPDPDKKERSMTETPAQSDQLPEEGPAEQVHDDRGDAAPREEATESPGTPGEEGTATGNPDAAGADEEGDASAEEGQDTA